MSYDLTNFKKFVKSRSDKSTKILQCNVPNLFICATLTTSVQVTVQRGRAVIDGVPVPKPAFGMILTFLAAIGLSGNKEEMIDVVVPFQGAFGSSDDPGGALFQVVAKQRLFGISGLEIFEIATVHVV